MISCTPKDNYKWKEYDKETIITLFNSEKETFDKVAKIISNSENFWNGARRDENATHAWIMSPNDKQRMDLFTQDEQIIIRDFFNSFYPYQIQCTNRIYVTIDFINNDMTSSFTFGYSSTDFLYNMNDEKNFTVLGEGWFFWL